MMNAWQGWLYVAAVLVPLAAFAVQFLAGRLLGRLNAYVATGAIFASFVLSVIGFFCYAINAEGFFSGHHHAEAETQRVDAGGRPVRLPSGSLGPDLAALADDPVATVKGWSRGYRRRAFHDVSMITSSNDGTTSTLQAGKIVVEGAASGVVTQVMQGKKAGLFFAEITDAPTAAPSAHAESAAHVGPSHPPLAWTGSVNWVALGKGLDEAQTHGGGHALAIPFGIHIDNLSVIMFVMVTFIATLIHVYSMGYMHDDPRYPRFFMYLSLFCFSMLGLLASASVFMVFMCWELVGVCSYLLIGFWYEEKKNVDAANKAFVVNRVGDIGMLIGLGLIWSYLGTFNIAEINRALTERLPDGSAYVHRDADGRLTRETARLTHGDVIVKIHEGGVADPPAQTRSIPYWVLTVAGLGVFAGCVGKSAQFPLHVWLPDAMAGPTPVSALIHAATMVAAGVYLVGRFFPLFTADVLLTIAYVGGITLFIAASIAMVQSDYKKVLAYSTVSQLGFMMLGLGVGGRSAGLFHLLTHAFFKALLFLGAGSIYHAVHTYQMQGLGGLRKKMPITAYTMLAATMAISGVPFLSGFYSKDAILAASFYFGWTRHREHILLFLLPVVGAAMTAFYMFRLWFLVFAGEPRGFPEPAGHGHGHAHHDLNPAAHAHESGPLMTWPLILLAIPTVMVGWPWSILPVMTPVLERMLEYGEPLASVDMGSAHYFALGASILIASAGIGLGVLYYGPWPAWQKWSAKRSAERFGPAYRFLVNKWYFDELYDAVLVKPALRLARDVRDFDRWVIDGIVNGMARLTVLLSWLEGLFDLRLVDGLVNAIAEAIYGTGDSARQIQTGRLRNYLMVLSAGVVGASILIFRWVHWPS